MSHQEFSGSGTGASLLLYLLTRFWHCWIEVQRSTVAVWEDGRKQTTPSIVQTLWIKPSTTSLFRKVRILRLFMVRSSCKLKGLLLTLSSFLFLRILTFLLWFVSQTIMAQGFVFDREIFPTRCERQISFGATSIPRSSEKKLMAIESVSSSESSSVDSGIP